MSSSAQSNPAPRGTELPMAQSRGSADPCRFSLFASYLHPQILSLRTSHQPQPSGVQANHSPLATCHRFSPLTPFESHLCAPPSQRYEKKGLVSPLFSHLCVLFTTYPLCFHTFTQKRGWAGGWPGTSAVGDLRSESDSDQPCATPLPSHPRGYGCFAGAFLGGAGCGGGGGGSSTR